MNSITLFSGGNSEATTTPRSAQRLQLHMHNDRQNINKLPTELLCNIFTIGEEAARSSRPRKSYYIGFQEVVTQVCHQWREVAIRCPTLWTYIHITRPSTYRLVSLYLDRAGPIHHLDIDLEMRKRFWKLVAIEARDWEAQLEKIPYLLKFLVSRGATVDRWRSLTVCAKQPEVLYAIIGFINAQPARALRFLSCRWKVRGYNSDIEELRSLDYPHLFSESYSFSAATMPKLRHVEFEAIPWGYVFNRASPIFTGLTTLALTSSYAPCSLNNLYKLLISNPNLEDLSLSVSKRAAHEFENEIEPDPEAFHVCLPQLRSLSFATSSFTMWVLRAIERIQAPALERLSISGCFKSSRESERLANHFRMGLRLEASAEAPSSVADLRAKSIHPALDELDISKLAMAHARGPLVDILSSLATITKLSVSGDHIRQMRKVPHVLPNLSHVYCSRVSYRQVGDMLRRRVNAGLPIGVVYLDQSDFQEAIGLHLPENVKYVRYHRDSMPRPDYDDSDPDSGDDRGRGEDILEGIEDNESIMDADSSESEFSS
ncbi:hypothetical protein B0J17DRAFT_631235 [Rhizoctonia solani]|nr:hypothetical protein B0J17DRAFT_631235 [Rhizoctonia solani]